jgi:hypothetical protein
MTADELLHEKHDFVSFFLGGPPPAGTYPALRAWRTNAAHQHHREPSDTFLKNVPDGWMAFSADN